MTICVGKSIIQTLASEGGWKFSDGESVVAADELFQNDPYAEIELLRKMLTKALLGLDQAELLLGGLLPESSYAAVTAAAGFARATLGE